MTRTRTTLTVDERLLRAARVEAARSGRRLNEVIEDALRDRYDLRAALAGVQRPGAPDLEDDEAMAVAVDELRQSRAERSRRRAA